MQHSECHDRDLVVDPLWKFQLSTSGELQERRWCGHVDEDETPDEPQHWVRTEVVALDKLATWTGRSFRSQVSSEWATPLTSENSRRWRIGEDDVAGGGQRNNVTRFFEHEYPLSMKTLRSRTELTGWASSPATRIGVRGSTLFVPWSYLEN